MKFMTKQMPFNPKFCFFVLLSFYLTWLATSDAVSCDSCGRECASACGTKHFRTCCFNYLRKRSLPPVAEIDVFSGQYNDGDFSSVEQKLENWLKNTKDIESVIRKAIDMDKMQINKKKKFNDENIMDF